MPLPLTFPLGGYFLEAPPTRKLKTLKGANFARLDIYLSKIIANRFKVLFKFPWMISLLSWLKEPVVYHTRAAGTGYDGNHRLSHDGSSVGGSVVFSVKGLLFVGFSTSSSTSPLSFSSWPGCPQAQGTHYSEWPSTGKALWEPQADAEQRVRLWLAISFVRMSTP